MTTIAELRAALRDQAEEEAYKAEAERVEAEAMQLHYARSSLALALDDCGGLTYTFAEGAATALIEGYQVRRGYDDDNFVWEVRRANGPWAYELYRHRTMAAHKLLLAMDAADAAYAEWAAQDTDGSAS